MELFRLDRKPLIREKALAYASAFFVVSDKWLVGNERPAACVLSFCGPFCLTRKIC